MYTSALKPCAVSVMFRSVTGLCSCGGAGRSPHISTARDGKADTTLVNVWCCQIVFMGGGQKLKGGGCDLYCVGGLPEVISNRVFLCFL